MHDTHVYEIVGEAWFRRSGNRSGPPLGCKIVRTRAALLARGEAIKQRDLPIGFREGSVAPESALAMVSVIVSGYENLVLSTWFDDWKNSDNLDGDDFQAGRPVDVAVPVEIFNTLVTTGRPVRSRVAGRDQRPRDFASPIVAVRINGRWEEPEAIY
jgi:hypothetical protein